jgi:hypothetical protein
MMPVELRQGARVRVLDLRSRAGGALAETLAAAAVLVDQGVLEVLAATEPIALLDALRAAGLIATGAAQADGTWLARAGRRALPALEDLTGLEPPEPMERVLLALSTLGPGEVFHARLPRNPVPLRGLLQARGVEYEIAMRPDGTALLWLTR